MRLLGGLGISLRISLISVLISIVLGIGVGMLMTLESKPIKILTRVYLEFIRIMPQMVLLFLVHFGATTAMGMNLSAESSAISVFALWGIAEMADLVRGALISIPVIQYETSFALGFNKWQTYLYIIIPQILRRMIPLSINLITRMIKTTSLVMMIGIVEVLKVGQQIIEANRKSSPQAAFGIFATIFFLYFIAYSAVDTIISLLEFSCSGQWSRMRTKLAVAQRL